MMVDLETLGQPPDGVIVAIGAVAFHPEVEGAVLGGLHVTVRPSTCVNAGLTLDAKTVEFWLKQPKETQQAALYDPEPVDLRSALRSLRSFYNNIGGDKANPKIPVWSHAGFDPTILDTAYVKVGQQTPWHRRSHRDMRTLESIAKKVDEVQANQRIPQKMRHHALDDAHRQVKQVWLWYRLLELGKLGEKAKAHHIGETFTELTPLDSEGESVVRSPASVEKPGSQDNPPHVLDAQ